MANVVEWNNEMIFHLIELYQARRLLWDPHHKDNRDKNKKVAAWNEIGRALNLDREAVQRKMKILITQFQREYAKTSDRGDDYISKWFAYNRLLFIKSTQPCAAPPLAPSPSPHPQPSALTSACVAPYKNTDEQLDIELKEEFDDDISEDDLYQQQQQPTTPAPAAALYRKRAAPSQDYSPPPREPPLKQSIIVARQTNSPAARAASVTTAATPTCPTESRDEYSVFGEYVAMKLRKLSDAYSRHKAQQEIHNILFSAEMGKFSQP